MADWRISGSYFEACNCDPICPCRRIDGVPGGRSTNGVCMGVLAWLVGEGHADGVELDGSKVALALWYSDDEEGSPWRFALYLDEEATPEQRQALEDLFLGRLGGDALLHFPWAWKDSRLLGVRTARIELDMTPRRQWLRVGSSVEVRIEGAYEGPEQVTCVIPGHDRKGEELVAALLRADDEEPVRFEYRGKCGYAADFDYAGQG